MARAQRIALLFVAVLAALLARPRAAHAVGEQTGRIKGVVTEATTGAPLGGIDIVASSPALIGGPRTVQANDDGTYELADLPPGAYDVTVSFAGTNPVVRRIKVRQGETAPLSVKWSAELKEVQTYNVIEETHLTRPDSTQTGTVLGADTEARIATGRSYQSVLTQVAGVSDPAGRGVPNIKGANRLSNHYLVDGMDVTDSVTNNFSTQVNFDSIGSLEVITGGMEAQYNALGGVINLNTATGSDQLHIDTSLYVNSDKLSVGPQVGNQLYEGTLPFSTAPALTTQSYQANLNVAGPLIKRRLWISVSLEYDYKESQIPIGPPFNVQHPPRREHDFFPRLKLTWAPGAKHRVTLSGNGDPALVYNRNQTNGTLPNSEYGQSQGGSFAVLQYDYFASQKTTFNLQTGLNYNTVSQYPMCQFGGADKLAPNPMFGPKNYVCDPNQAQHVNNDDQSTWYNGGQINLDRRYTVQFDPSLSLRGKWLGEHDAKVGIQSRFVYHTFSQHTPGGTSFTESGGGPGEGGLCDPDTGAGCNKNTLRNDTPDFANHQWGFGIGAYIQDRWRVWKRVVLLPGIRFDYGLTKNSLGQTVSSLFGVGPRLGVTVDLTGDAKT
ncbi:MAG TPA: TonB-dependent receptor, partial [Polyangia bacterium]